MGEVSAIGDHKALARAIIKILGDRERYVRDVALISASFDPHQTAEDYVSLFEDLRQKRKRAVTAEPPAYDRLRAMRDNKAADLSG
jgi:hypothetical protein